MSFLKELKQDEDKRRNIAFQTIVGLRDALGLATKKQQPPTYEQSLAILYDLNEDFYNDVCDLISSKNDNDTVKYYKEEATLQSTIEQRQIIPEDLIKKEINRLTNLKREANLPKEDIRFIERKIAQLYAGLENLTPRKLSENRILNRDHFLVDRSHYFAEEIFKDDFHIDYKLANRKILRLRLLHPDTPEQLTGADLIYEQYDNVNNKIRFIFLQYKTWDKGSIYFSQHKNLLPQMEKMHNSLCENGFCDKPDKQEIIEKYRFPYCCGFLRPTDKLQSNNSKMISSGLYIPVCAVRELSKTLKCLKKNELKTNTLNHKHFEELFNLNIIGSRWLDVDEVEDFYKEKGIIQDNTTLKIYAREIFE